MERMNPRARQHIRNNAMKWMKSDDCPPWVACLKQIKTTEATLDVAAKTDLSQEDQQMLFMVGLCYDDFADQWKTDGLCMEENIYAIYHLIVTSRNYRTAAEDRLKKWHQATQRVGH